MTIEVDDFLMHYGVKGMRWGKRQSSEPRTPLTRKQKIAIAVGVGSTVAVGAVIALSIMDKKVNDGGGFSFGDMPVQTMTTNKTMMSGKANLIFNAAAMSTPVPKKGLSDKAKEKAFDTAKTAAANKIRNTSYDDFKSMRNPKPRNGIKAKAKGAIDDKANEIIIKKIRDVAIKKANQIDTNKKGRR